MFWAADSRALAFFAAGTLKRVSVAGGSPQPCSRSVNRVLRRRKLEQRRSDLVLQSLCGQTAIFSLASPGGTPTAVPPLGARD